MRPLQFAFVGIGIGIASPKWGVATERKCFASNANFECGICVLHFALIKCTRQEGAGEESER